MPTEGLKSAADSTKQIITLASGIVALTVTFAKEFKPQGAQSLPVPGELKLAWILYGVTVFFGVWALLAITGSLAKADADANAVVSANDTNVKIPGYGMVGSFILAFALTIYSGFSIVR